MEEPNIKRIRKKNNQCECCKGWIDNRRKHARYCKECARTMEKLKKIFNGKLRYLRLKIKEMETNGNKN